MTDVQIDLRHAKVASLPDDLDSEVSTSEWNEQHVVAPGSITTEMLDSGVMTDVGTVWWNGHGPPGLVVRPNAISNPRGVAGGDGWLHAGFEPLEPVTFIEGVTIPGGVALAPPASTSENWEYLYTGYPVRIALPGEPGDWIFLQFDLYLGGTVEEGQQFYVEVSSPTDTFLTDRQIGPVDGFGHFSYCWQITGASSDCSFRWSMFFGNQDGARLYLTNILVEAGVEGELPAPYSESGGTNVPGSKIGDYYLDLDTDLVYQLE
jgi:hypothetical protein